MFVFLRTSKVRVFASGLLTLSVFAACLSSPAGAAGDPAVNQFLMANPLPNGVSAPDALTQSLATSAEAQEDALIAGSGYAKVAVGLWVDPTAKEEVVAELVAFTNPPADTSSVALGAEAACPPAAGVAPVVTTVALIPGSAEVSCVDASTGLPSTAIEWFSANVLALVVVLNLTPAQSEAISLTQSGLLPTTGINLSASNSFVVGHFAATSASLSATEKLQIDQDAVTINTETPTEVTFTAHQSSKGLARVSRKLAISRVVAIDTYLVAQLTKLGMTAATLQTIGLGNGHPFNVTYLRGSPSSSLSVKIGVAYLK